MIQFLTDYDTKAVPSEHFSKDQRVEREEGSELYFVRLGIAAFVVDGELVDQDHRPLIDSGPVVVNDLRGTVAVSLGLITPARASSSLAVGTPEVVLRAELERVGIVADQAGADLLGAQAERDEARAEAERLTTALTAVEEGRTEAQRERDEAQGERDEARREVDDLRQQLVEAKAPTGDGGDTGQQNSPPPPPTKPARGR